MESRDTQDPEAPGKPDQGVEAQEPAPTPLQVVLTGPPGPVKQPWGQEAGPKRKGDTAHKGVSIIKEVSKDLPQKVVGNDGKLHDLEGGQTKEDKSETPQVDVLARINSVIEASFGLVVKKMEGTHRAGMFGLFSGNDPRPVCAVRTLEGKSGIEFSVLGYAFAPTQVVNKVIQPLVKEFGVHSYQPYTRMP